MVTCELVTSITAIACTIAQHYSKEELPLIAAAFTQLGDTLGTLIAQQDACSEDVEK
jgi:hypothetical protein